MTEEVFKAKQRLNEFLKEHPELLPLQQEITKRLNSAGNQHNRIAILNFMMQDSLQQLLVELESLKQNMEKL